MSTRCEDVTDRLMELLYQELPADERGALEAHVAGCDRCRAELASFQRTRSLARAALDVPAPAGVHQRLVAAAVLEAAARGARRATAPVASPASAAPVASGGGGGPWQKLRGRWTLPTLATVGAMAVFLLTSRVFLNQEATVERSRRVTEPQDEPRVVAKAPSPIVVPMEQPRPPEPPAARDREQKMAEVEKLARTAVSAAAREESAPRKPSPFPGVADEGEQRPGSRGGSVRHRSDASARSAGAPAPVAGHQLPVPAVTPPPPQAAPASRPGPSKGSMDDLLDSALSAKSRPSAAPAARAPPVERAVSAGGGSPVMAEAESAPAPSQAEDRAQVEKKMSRVAASEERTYQDVSAAPRRSSGAASESVEAMAQRAERLFKEGHWSDAVTLFERLLRQFPKNAQAPQWRQRLAAARTQLNATEQMP